MLDGGWLVEWLLADAVSGVHDGGERESAMRRKPRLDANHREIADMLTGIGCSVQSLAALGGGVPDLLVGYQGETYLIEVKDGSKPPSHRRLTADEDAWVKQWRGRSVVVAKDVAEALAAIEDARNGAAKRLARAVEIARTALRKADELPEYDDDDPPWERDAMAMAKALRKIAALGDGQPERADGEGG